MDAAGASVALLEFVNAGGSLANVGLFLYCIKQFGLLDRRLLRLEIKTGNEGQGNGSN